MDIRVAEAFGAGIPIRLDNPSGLGKEDFQALGEEILRRTGECLRLPSGDSRARQAPRIRWAIKAPRGPRPSARGGAFLHPSNEPVGKLLGGRSHIRAGMDLRMPRRGFTGGLRSAS